MKYWVVTYRSVGAGEQTFEAWSAKSRDEAINEFSAHCPKYSPGAYRNVRSSIISCEEVSGDC
jgi:hypothetical protein